MMGKRRGALGLVLAVGLIGAGAGPAVGQSLTSTRGLGYPLLPTDARSESVGGLGIGLQSHAAPLLNPASAARVRRRGVVASVAAAEQTAELGGVSDGFGMTRFPLLQVLYPVRGIVLTAGYGGYLDQSWAVRMDGEYQMDDDTIGYRDFARSTGGIGQFQLGAAMPIGERLAVGLAAGVHTGERRLEHERVFETTPIGDLRPFTTTATVRYSGPLAQLGVQWDPMDPVRVAASVTWAGTLRADSTAGRAKSTAYDLPLQVAGGVSAYLAPTLLATVSGRWSGWSSVGTLETPMSGGVTTSARDTWEVGGGLELDDPARRTARSYPIRIGGQYRQLPFTFSGTAPTEWFVGAGAGARIGADIDNPLARIDFTVQRGERTAPGSTTGTTDEIGPLEETAWRFVLTLSIFGN